MIINKNSQTISLRSLLESEGYSFPCGGKGICGRCRIVAATLPITDLDKRFLSDTELSRGVRLACNKTLSSPLEITECTLPLKVERKKLTCGNVVAILFPNRTEILLIDADSETVAETLILPTANDPTALRAIVGKNSVELFEKYSLATAPTLFLCGANDKIKLFLNGASPEAYLNAADFALPADELFVSPLPKNGSSSGVLELLDEPDGTLLIEIYGDQTAIMLKSQTAPFSANLPTSDYAEIIKYLGCVPPHAETLIITDKSTDGLPPEFLSFMRKSKAAENAATATSSLRKRTKLKRLAESF